MTLPHDCKARLTMLQQTIERNRKNLIPHDAGSESKAPSNQNAEK